MREYEFVTTDDGSPSLRISDGQPGESMHSLRGAFSETIYIYATAVEWALNKGLPPRYLSVGLGLGYNELMATGLLLNRGVKPSSIVGASYELDPMLCDYFVRWLNSEMPSVLVNSKVNSKANSPPSTLAIPLAFQSAYDDILKRVAERFSIAPDVIRETLLNWLDNRQWLVNGPLTVDTFFSENFSVVFFDAFSSKSSPDLWDEQFLDAFLKNAFAAHGVLSTYACTGSLKRSLKRHGFTIEVRPGFAGKRESIFASR